MEQQQHRQQPAPLGPVDSKLLSADFASAAVLAALISVFRDGFAAPARGLLSW